MQLYATTTSPFARKIRILMMEKGIDFEIINDNVWLPEPQVSAVNPLSQVPCLVLNNGYSVYDSRVIEDYLEELAPLHVPSDPVARLETKKWAALADGLIDAAIKILLEKRRPADKFMFSAIEHQTKKIHLGLALAEEQLAHHFWCANNTYSLADVTMVCFLSFMDLRLSDMPWRETYPNVAKLTDYLNTQPMFAQTMPYVS